MAVGLQYAVGPMQDWLDMVSPLFVLDMSLCLSSGEAIYVVPRCLFEVVVDR